MTLRSRIIAAGAVLVLAPFVVVGIAIRVDAGNRLRAQYRERVDGLVDLATRELVERRRQVDARITALGEALREDDRLRLALSHDTDETYLRDWAPRALLLTGLDALQIQDTDGRILSSGHFRNDFGRRGENTVCFLAGLADRPGLVPLRRPAGAFWALARVDSLTLSGRKVYVVGGLELDRAALEALVPGGEVAVALTGGGSRIATDDELGRALGASGAEGLGDDWVVRTIELTELVPPDAELSVQLVVAHSLASMRDVLRALDLRLALAFGLGALGTVLLATRLSARITRPLEQLAARTREVDLDRLDVEFATSRTDEVGTLSRFLGEMTQRLRGSVARLRDAERRATLGDLARQVNHDLKNAFPPIRNVVQHLSEVADSPPDLARIFAERRATLDSGLAYLDDLAASWRRLAARPERAQCDVGAIAREVAAGRTAGDGPVQVVAGGDVPPVRADALGLRRVVENLVANACESGAGRVTIAIGWAPGGDERSPGTVTIAVEDDGPGLAPDARDHAFDPYWTTRAKGSGLGLSIVRRLVSDFEGSVRIDSEEGRGTRVEVVLPATGSP